jgi:hypothetical protein
MIEPESLSRYAATISAAYRNPVDVRGLRKAHAAALRATAELIEELMATLDAGEGAEMFLRLAAALDDINSGSRPAIFELANLSGVTVAETDVWIARAHAVVGLEMFIASGLGSAESIEFAAKHFKGLNALLKTGAKLETSLKNWRLLFIKGDCKSPLGMQTFSRGRSIALALNDPQKLKSLGTGALKDAERRARFIAAGA